MSETPLQREVRENSIRTLREMEEALKMWDSPYDRAQCRAAYGRLCLLRQDQIAQRHGLPPMLIRART